MKSLLYSPYIIDGVPQDVTPAQMLDECCVVPRPGIDGALREWDVIADESLDPTPRSSDYDSWRIQEYRDLIRDTTRTDFPFPFAAQYTKLRIAEALADVLWRAGSLRLGDLALSLHWRWNQSEVGRAAAFYASAQAAGEYIDSLGLGISSYSVTDSAQCGLEIEVAVDADAADDFTDGSFRSADPVLLPQRACPAVFDPDPDSWIVYIPLETCAYRLGGSLLSEALGMGGTVAPDLEDPDYFIDGFEVVREMVEDGIPLSGMTVRRGGLLAALDKMSVQVGARVNVYALMKSVGEQDIVRTLFAEVPGAILQIRDQDFDYIDAEFTLQDVAFFPLGHPEPGRRSVRVDSSDRDSIQTILESIIRSQSSEGED